MIIIINSDISRSPLWLPSLILGTIPCYILEILLGMYCMVLNGVRPVSWGQFGSNVIWKIGNPVKKLKLRFSDNVLLTTRTHTLPPGNSRNRPLLRSRGNIVASHLAGPGSIPGRVGFLGWGLSSTVRHHHQSILPQGQVLHCKLRNQGHNSAQKAGLPPETQEPRLQFY